MILLSAILGSLMTGLTMTVVLAARKIRSSQGASSPPPASELEDDRPPPDYAAKTTDGILQSTLEQLRQAACEMGGG